MIPLERRRDHGAADSASTAGGARIDRLEMHRPSGCPGDGRRKGRASGGRRVSRGKSAVVPRPIAGLPTMARTRARRAASRPL